MAEPHSRVSLDAVQSVPVDCITFDMIGTADATYNMPSNCNDQEDVHYFVHRHDGDTLSSIPFDTTDDFQEEISVITQDKMYDLFAAPLLRSSRFNSTQVNRKPSLEQRVFLAQAAEVSLISFLFTFI